MIELRVVFGISGELERDDYLEKFYSKYIFDAFSRELLFQASFEKYLAGHPAIGDHCIFSNQVKFEDQGIADTIVYQKLPVDRQGRAIALLEYRTPRKLLRLSRKILSQLIRYGKNIMGLHVGTVALPLILFNGYSMILGKVVWETNAKLQFSFVSEPVQIYDEATKQLNKENISLLSALLKRVPQTRQRYVPYGNAELKLSRCIGNGASSMVYTAEKPLNRKLTHGLFTSDIDKPKPYSPSGYAVKFTSDLNALQNELKILKLLKGLKCCPKFLTDNILPAPDNVSVYYIILKLYKQIAPGVFSNSADGLCHIEKWQMKGLLNYIISMHTRGVIHRDIRLDNLLSDGANLILCDYGFAVQETNVALEYCGTVATASSRILKSLIKNRSAKIKPEKSDDLVSLLKLFVTHFMNMNSTPENSGDAKYYLNYWSSSQFLLEKFEALTYDEQVKFLGDWFSKFRKPARKDTESKDKDKVDDVASLASMIAADEPMESDGANQRITGAKVKGKIAKTAGTYAESQGKAGREAGLAKKATGKVGRVAGPAKKAAGNNSKKTGKAGKVADFAKATGTEARKPGKVMRKTSSLGGAKTEPVRPNHPKSAKKPVNPEDTKPPSITKTSAQPIQAGWNVVPLEALSVASSIDALRQSKRLRLTHKR